ncbi:MAG: hypothetical protein CFE24_10315 [Flavobacterium sp. BFFFF2]|nr:MAG: hypothetical protein CFE24_10315 [Flavobacterium sp. BFFFF2]
MLKKMFFFSVMLLAINAWSQLDNQTRFTSDSREYFIWSEEKGKYELHETEYEHSLIDLREIGSKTNGYVTLSLVDNGTARLYHGSIYEYRLDGPDNDQGIWSLRNKVMRSRLLYNPKENTVTYSFEADDIRYRKFFVFHITAIDNYKK